MLITHEYWQCPSCETVIEVTDQDRELKEMCCDVCGYSLEFSDQRFETFIKEF